MKVLEIMSTHLLLVLLVAHQVCPQAADYDDDDGGEDSRRIHRRRRPQQQPYLGGGGPCGRDANGDGRFLSLNYINVNYHVNCGGGGGHYNGGGGYYPGGGGYYTGGGPAAVYGGGFGGGGGHKPHRPQRPQKPGGGLLGSHVHNQGGGGILGSHLQGGGLFGSHGGGQGGLFGGSGGIFGGNRPQAIIQDITSGVGDLLNRPVPNLGLGGGGGSNNNGLLGFGIFDGSILNSFTSLFTNNNRPTNTNQPSTDVQYVQDNNDVNTSVDNGGIVEEKPVHEEHDELEEAYSNKLKRNRYVSASPSYGGYNYNRVVNKVNREINQAIRPLYQLFRR